MMHALIPKMKFGLLIHLFGFLWTLHLVCEHTYASLVALHHSCILIGFHQNVRIVLLGSGTGDQHWLLSTNSA